MVTNPEVPGIRVVVLGEGLRKPRWLSHVLFAQKVARWIEENSNEESIVHSHERISCHNITTIHSTLFNFPRRGFTSFRKYMNEYLEKREVSNQSLIKIVPVSQVIEIQLQAKYPDASRLISDPISPGVTKIQSNPKSYEPKSPVIGFIGNEWKRKGLAKVIEIWRSLDREGRKPRLCLAGFPEEQDVGLSEEEMESVEILGYVKSKKDFYQKIDLLIHPAKKEAYGMVIAEALSLGIPVICSSECGAAIEIDEKKGASLKESDPIERWVEKTNYWLCEDRPRFKHDPFTWTKVAQSYRTLYEEFRSSL
jgi:glycosyltransferase involved in cell wall biosynthesis